MNSKLKTFLAGIGSVMVILPAGSVSQISTPRRSDSENLSGDWVRVGNDLKSAMQKIDGQEKV